jgi:hypothetical protein
MTKHQQAQKAQTLPLSIVVRNLFPPLAVTTAVKTSSSTTTKSSSPVDDDDSVANDTDYSDVHDRNYDDEEEEYDDDDHHNHINPMMVTTAFTSIERRCAWVSRNILHRLRLDIILKNQPEDDTGTGSGTSENTTTVIVCSMEQSHGTPHPRWDHVNERLLLSSTGPVPITECYARFVILNHGDDTRDGEAVLAEITLNPWKLRCLPSESDNTNNNHNTDNNSGRSRRNNMTSGMQMIIPHTLPPNTILIHYDDGCTRVLPDVYSLLLQREIIREEANNRDGAGELGWGGKQPQEREVPVFEEKVFDLLAEKSNSDVDVSLDTALSSASTFAPSSSAKEVASAELLPSPKNKDASSSVIFDDCIFDLMGSTDGNSSSGIGQSQTAAVETDAHVALSVDNEAHADTSEAGLQSNVLLRQDADDEKREEERVGPTTSSADREPEDELPMLALPAFKIENKLITSTADEEEEKEIEELRRLVHVERQLLETDWHRVTQVKLHLRRFIIAC